MWISNHPLYPAQYNRVPGWAFLSAQWAVSSEELMRKQSRHLGTSPAFAGKYGKLTKVSTTSISLPLDFTRRLRLWEYFDSKIQEVINIISGGTSSKVEHHLSCAHSPPECLLLLNVYWGSLPIFLMVFFFFFATELYELLLCFGC